MKSGKALSNGCFRSEQLLIFSGYFLLTESVQSVDILFGLTTFYLIGFAGLSSFHKDGRVFDVPLIVERISLCVKASPEYGEAFFMAE